MPNKSQSGFSPILIIILLAVIAGASILVIKNIPFNQPEPSFVVQPQSTDSAQAKTSPSPTAKNSSVTSAKKPTPIPTKAPTNIPTSADNNNNQSNQNNSNNPTATSTNQPTNTPTAAPFPANPYVKITSPKGGESFKEGDTVNITWDTNLISNQNVTLALCHMQAIDSYNSGPVIPGYIGVNIRSHTWTATLGGNVAYAEKQLKISMLCQDTNGGAETAESNYFTVHK